MHRPRRGSAVKEKEKFSTESEAFLLHSYSKELIDDDATFSLRLEEAALKKVERATLEKIALCFRLFLCRWSKYP